MTLWEIILIGVSLSMDAFAVSIADGMMLSMGRLDTKCLHNAGTSLDDPDIDASNHRLKQSALCHQPVVECFLPLGRKCIETTIALTFGIFQAVMPMAGYALVVLCGHMGQSVYNALHTGGHYVAMGLLCLLGGKMIAEGISSHHKDKKDDVSSMKLTPVTLLVQGVATSIDALAVGISLGAVGEDIVRPALIIGATTTVICLPAVYLGRRAERYAGKWAAVAGGAVLAAIGVKIGIAG